MNNSDNTHNKKFEECLTLKVLGYLEECFKDYNHLKEFEVTHTRVAIELMKLELFCRLKIKAGN